MILTNQRTLKHENLCSVSDKEHRHNESESEVGKVNIVPDAEGDKPGKQSSLL